MKDFNEFIKTVNENIDTVLFDTCNDLDEISESQRTITKEEWLFIEKTIFKSNIAMLRQYHKWLHEDNQ